MAMVVVVRVHVANVRRPRQAIRRRQCAPFSRLLYVFPPLLRILCRNKFFLRRIKILEGHSEYLARCGDIDVPRWEQNGCATTSNSSSSVVRIGVTSFQLPSSSSSYSSSSSSFPSSSSSVLYTIDTRVSHVLEKEHRSVRCTIANRRRRPLAGTASTFARANYYTACSLCLCVLSLSLSFSFSLFVRCVSSLLTARARADCGLNYTLNF